MLTGHYNFEKITSDLSWKIGRVDVEIIGLREIVKNVTIKIAAFINPSQLRFAHSGWANQRNSNIYEIRHCLWDFLSNSGLENFATARRSSQCVVLAR